MRRHSFLIAFICVTACISAMDVDSSNRYTITGKFVATDIEDDDAQQNTKRTSPMVVMSRKNSTTNNNDATVELASGVFDGDTISFEGEIEEPTEVAISVELDETKYSIDALIVPGGENVSFVFIKGTDSKPHQLALLGESRRSAIPKQRFTVTGNIRTTVEDISNATVSISAFEALEGSSVGISFGVVMLDNGEFLIEADIYEPRVVNIVLRNNSGTFETRAVVEPSSELTLALRTGTSQLLATAKSGRHFKLVESWQQSNEYLSTLDAYSQSYGKFIADLQAQIEGTTSPKDDEPEESAQSSDESEEHASQTNTAMDDQNSDKSVQTERVGDTSETLTPKVAKGCEHVDVDIEKPISIAELMRTRGGPQYFMLSQKLDKIRTDALQHIANNSDDQWDVLLAMELEAYGYYDENRKDALVIYEKLTASFDDDVVARRVQQPRDRLAFHLEREENDESLIPGQKVPDVSLPDLRGDSFSLYEVLALNDVVLIDFWASWCGPCIEMFPTLRRLYSTYSESGFEIVSISIDESFEAWEEGSQANELPWTNLGENEGWEGSVAKMYGVQLIPKSYLVDSQGCILKKMLHSDILEEFLKTKFDADTENGVLDPTTN